MHLIFLKQGRVPKSAFMMKKSHFLPQCFPKTLPQGGIRGKHRKSSVTEFFINLQRSLPRKSPNWDFIQCVNISFRKLHSIKNFNKTFYKSLPHGRLLFCLNWLFLFFFFVFVAYNFLFSGKKCMLFLLQKKPDMLK